MTAFVIFLVAIVISVRFRTFVLTAIAVVICFLWYGGEMMRHSSDLDRLGRSLQHLVEVVADLESRGVGLRSLTENIDTSSAGGRLVFHVFAAMAEFERNLTRERCLAGLAAARARGKTGGRRPVLTGSKLDLAKRLRTDRSIPVDEA